MPNYRISFNKAWLNQKDLNGHLLKEWCENTGSLYDVFCRYCKKNIRCDNRGLSQLIDHSKSVSHTSAIQDVVTGRQLTFDKDAIKCTPAVGEFSKSVLTTWSTADSKVKAELLWALKVVSSNYSYNSCQGLNELFMAMFPDSSLAADFSVSPSKISYLISEAAGPYFHELLLNDLKMSKSPFVICYDELTNKDVKKQLDLKVRYWSNEKNGIKVHHLDTYIMGRASGRTIAEKIIKSINDGNLLLSNLVTLGSDGPNVNKTVFNIISESKKEQNIPALINIGTCTLHVVHNAFGKALKVFGHGIVDFVIDIHSFFKLSPVRQEELKELQEEFDVSKLKFLKHVECRWLTLTPAMERIKNQWAVLVEYFVKELPKHDKNLSDNSRYVRILNNLKKSETTLALLNFLITVSKMFDSYLNIFQREESQIHILHDCMTSLLRRIFERFIKSEELRKRSVDELILVQLPCTKIELSNDDIETGVHARTEIEKMKPERQRLFLHGVRKFYYMLIKTLAENLPLNNTILKNSRCIAPQHRCESWTVKAVKELATSVPLVPRINIDLLADEWRMLQCEDLSKELDPKNGQVDSRIDCYWSKIFSLKNAFGENKFGEVTKLVKAILILPHGNADVERGFSQTSNFLTDGRTRLSRASISASQSTKDGLKDYSGELHRVPITRAFIEKGKMAYKSYTARLEEEKRVQAELKKKKAEEEQKKKKRHWKSKEKNFC